MPLDSKKPGRLNKSEAILATTDVVSTIAFYRDVLGFPGHWLHGEPPDFGGVEWGSVSLMFKQAPELANRVAGHEHYFFCSGIEELYERHGQNGATLASPLEIQPWGLREYVVIDPNGYRLRFGEFAGSRQQHSDGSQTINVKDTIRIENRLPTVDELIEMHASVGWTHLQDPQFAQKALDNSIAGVVAIDCKGPTPQIVGMARTAGDDVSYYHILDVAVKPDYQLEGIGSLIVDHLLDLIDQRAPKGAYVGLFARQSLHRFYHRFQFLDSQQSFPGFSLCKGDQPLARFRRN